MLKGWREVVIGFVIALFIFLGIIGVNILPFVGVALVISVIYLAMKSRSGSLTVGRQQRRVGGSSKPSYLTFEQIGGQERAKQELIEALDFLINHEEIKKFGIRPLKGILLTGPPGTGKTLMAKAAAHYSNAVYAAASGSEFVEMYVGVGAGRIRDLFKQARDQAVKEKKENAIIFIDEIDVIGGKREGGQQKEYDQTLNQLLTEMDGIYSNSTPRVLVIAATNRKEMLDSALLRPGRFDRHIRVDLPDKKGRLHILNIHAENKPMDNSVQLDTIAVQSFGFSGAQLESVMNEAAIYAMREKLEQIEQRHLTMAIDKVMLGEKTDREATNEERRRVAIHELGHAIIAEIVRPGSVAQVTVSPRGQALGYVRHNPLKDQYLHTKEFLESQIMIALGGAAAEEIFYGGRSTGSSNDFEQSLQIVETMMNAGLTNLGITNVQIVTQEERMKENERIMNELFERTRNELESHKMVFEKTLEFLISEEVVSGDQFRRIFCDNIQLPA